MFKRGFKQNGPIRLSTYLRAYHVGDIVDIKANAAEQKGMVSSADYSMSILY